MSKTTMAKAINNALREEMSRDERVFLLGELIGDFGGTFTVTKGLLEEFGSKRVVDTPISENAIVGAAVGAAMTGTRPVAEIMYSDFLTCAMDQVVNQAAKMRLMSGGKAKVPMVIRAAVGANTHGAQHAQCPEAWFMHTPGLKVVFPSTPYDAKGLLKTAIRDDNPVLFFEHKYLYGAKPVTTGGKPLSSYDDLVDKLADIPEEEYTIPLGKADIKRGGTHITVVATGLMVHKCLSVAAQLEVSGIDVEIIDPRTLVPLDEEAILASVRKTGRIAIVSEDHLCCGVGSEIASIVTEKAFDYLDAPPLRISSLNMPMPFAPKGEDYVVPNEERIYRELKELTA
ncbi:MAG: alpha-ketoacid dehydrogenase subunit beta [Armatimonadetes bacterium]|nr:alpha-ketoacid dehydrogenase subunit beta [Armatimonadota bacterium]